MPDSFRVRRAAAMVLLGCAGLLACDYPTPGASEPAPQPPPRSAAPIPAGGPSAATLAPPTPTIPATTPASLDFDALSSIRAAFYYPWFPETWAAPGGGTFTNLHPSAGLYDSSDPATIARHLDELAYAHVDVAISSWWGSGTPTANRFDELLDASTSRAIKWAIYYEPEGYSDPSTASIVADLGPTVRAHANDDRILRLGGRFVVFVYGDANDDCGMSSRWKGAADALGIYIVLKVFDGYEQCSSQPDGWHQYAPARASDAQLPWSYAVSPGFWLYGEPQRLARDPAAFRNAVTAMVASGAKFQLVTTFNEWGEGTAVEPADEWASASGYGAYLDILHEIPPRP